MQQKKESNSPFDKRERPEEGFPAPPLKKSRDAGSNTTSDILEQAPTGAGAAAVRSGKGGKSGGGMGGQQAGGIKGGGK